MGFIPWKCQHITFFKWYKRLFGFDLVESGINAHGTKWGIVAFNDTMISMSEHAKKTAADKNEDRSFHRIYHIGIRVSDKEQWQQIVKENKLKVQYGGAVDYPHSKSWYINDPSGHEIEVSYTDQERLQFPS